jgi:hypothetical protein
MLTPNGYTFQVKTRGQTWSATWRLDGKDVCVDSAYGSRRIARGRRPAEKVAEEALTDLVQRWASVPAGH